jgi:hypothetical protein
MLDSLRTIKERFMNTAVTTIIVISGVYFLLGALMLNTSNSRSSFLFKVVPFFLGMGLLASAAYLNGLAFQGPAQGASAASLATDQVALVARPPRVPCVRRLRPADVDSTAVVCQLARNEIAPNRRLIGVIGAETLFEASEMPIWKVNGRIV